MKYSDWCISYYKEKHPEFQEDMLNAEKRQKIKRDVSERLILRLNCLTGKCYGVGKELDTIYYSATNEEDEIKKIMEEHYQRIKEREGELDLKLQNLEEKLQKTIEKKKDIIPEMELQELIEKKKNKIDEFRKQKEALYDREIEGLVIVKKRFEVISRIERLFFEFLLTTITEEKVRKIRVDKWECLDWKYREIIIMLLHEVKYYFEWQLCEDDIKYIEFKLRYPIQYRMIIVQDILEEELVNDTSVSEMMQCIYENVDKLYKIASQRNVDDENLIDEEDAIDRFIYNAINKNSKC